MFSYCSGGNTEILPNFGPPILPLEIFLLRCVSYVELCSNCSYFPPFRKGLMTIINVTVVRAAFCLTLFQFRAICKHVITVTKKIILVPFLANSGGNTDQQWVKADI
jgi:hypothetical protein